ncbi:Metallo-beta-lactamase superfamily [Peptoniphilus sp. ING2-D1G]|nr:Metallo-beta-lactamase superfamily [Peptoniphilus sp. ING2-D1G]
MKITALVENESKCELKSVHGLSLYIETKKHKILFDLGPDDTLFENAKMRGIDLGVVDIVIISHGHSDHGGALEKFLELNFIAKIYVQKRAFEPYYSKSSSSKMYYIGLDEKYKNHPQVVLVDGDYEIDDELLLFTVKNRDKYYSNANDNLYAQKGKDEFEHEQNLIIREEKSALIMGCGHMGVVNIMEKADKYNPAVCVGGYHLHSPSGKNSASTELLNAIAMELKKYTQTAFYTCHCTGMEEFNYLSGKLSNLYYLHCGESIEV